MSEVDDDEAFLVAIKSFCDCANARLRRHEGLVHGGQPCHDERGNMLAYIAHRIGLTMAAAIVMAERLEDYAREHPNA